MKCKDELFLYKKACKGSYGVDSRLVVNGLQSIPESTALKAGGIHEWPSPG